MMNPPPSLGEFLRKNQTTLCWTVLFFLLEFLSYAFFDQPIASLTQELDQKAHTLINFFRATTDLGKGAVYLWPSGLLALACLFAIKNVRLSSTREHQLSRWGANSLFIFLTVSSSGIAVNIIKHLIGRARPTLWLHEGIYGFHPFTFFINVWNGMPSGHTTTAFAVAFSLSYLVPKGRPFWLLYALFLGLSRIMVNAHYLSDVCAGAMLGWLTTELGIRHGTVPIRKLYFPLTNTKKSNRKYP